MLNKGCDPASVSIILATKERSRAQRGEEALVERVARPRSFRLLTPNTSSRVFPRKTRLSPPYSGHRRPQMRVGPIPRVAAAAVLLLAGVMPAAAQAVPKLPKASAELRWFMPGLLSGNPVISRWFASLRDDSPPPRDGAQLVQEPSTPAGAALDPPRTDYYLLPTDRDFGIKVRGPSEVPVLDGEFVAELKRLARVPRRNVTVRGSRGTLEAWKKWSLRATEEAPPNFAPLLDDEDTAELRTIRKTRTMKVFRAREDGACRPGVEIDVEVELTDLLVMPFPGSAAAPRPFYTLGFEASNPGRATERGIPGGFAALLACVEQVARERVFIGADGEPAFVSEASMGYAEFLIRAAS
ncbi:hypothetical protein DFJ74DRAFT_728638 [Hyaloraphidium curvatum]|nr:hypothetical protein DFJ74DRAFT_728638 [Hyaloraphidium curvatum]